MPAVLLGAVNGRVALLRMPSRPRTWPVRTRSGSAVAYPPPPTEAGPPWAVSPQIRYARLKSHDASGVGTVGQNGVQLCLAASPGRRLKQSSGEQLANRRRRRDGALQTRVGLQCARERVGSSGWIEPFLRKRPENHAAPRLPAGQGRQLGGDFDRVAQPPQPRIEARQLVKRFRVRRVECPRFFQDRHRRLGPILANQAGTEQKVILGFHRLFVDAAE